MTKYNHRSIQSSSASLREIVFGMEDGMVSTLGAVTGIAIGSQDHFTVILAGTVIIAVESISMGVGSYLSNRSELDMKRRYIREEKEEIINYPGEERKELVEMFIRDGWPSDLAHTMTEAASRKKRLMLKEMAYRELHIIPSDESHPWANGLKMFFSYIAGGLIPLVAYFLVDIDRAMPISVIITLLGLFCLGVMTARFTKKIWWRSGLRMLALGGTAMVIGLVVGELVRLN